jgi:hypothetical protein
VEISKQEELRIQPPSKRSISCVFDTIHNEINFLFSLLSTSSLFCPSWQYEKDEKN